MLKGLKKYTVAFVLLDQLQIQTDYQPHFTLWSSRCYSTSQQRALPSLAWCI